MIKPWLFIASLLVPLIYGAAMTAWILWSDTHSGGVHFPDPYDHGDLGDRSADDAGALAGGLPQFDGVSAFGLHVVAQRGHPFGIPSQMVAVPSRHTEHHEAGKGRLGSECRDDENSDASIV